MVVFAVRINSNSFFKYRAYAYFLVYDVLTGDIKLSLRVSNTANDSRERCIRDVSWHPYENFIISTSVKYCRNSFFFFFFFCFINMPDVEMN
jgi:hypothetical protein